MWEDGVSGSATLDPDLIVSLFLFQMIIFC
jgi:hypothetical protein